jgi:demethylmenaquinone methyltransferase/2-methoxy-6-polyprenyl-1,4-benzoquinol methylase
VSARRDPALEEQRAYYRARAPEYDEWWLRRGRYDRGAEVGDAWFAEAAEVAAALESFRPEGRILELACGTGIWSERLLPHASTLTLLDASREMLDLATARLWPAHRVDTIHADVFEWRPDATFDTVFFGFWLSHVPPARFDDFWDLVRRSLAPNGRVFFVDSRCERASAAVDHRPPEPDATTQPRRLNDGREFVIYKVYYDPPELEQRLRSKGWRFEVRETSRYFVYGQGERASGERAT